MGMKLNPEGVSHARSLIDAGKINRGEWSFSAEDGNHLLGSDGTDWAAYRVWFLAEDTGAAEETRARFKFPFGKDGEVFPAALKAAEGRATQDGYTAVAEAAKGLLADAEPDDDKGKNAGPAPGRTRDAKDGDPLPGEPGDDPDGDDDTDTDTGDDDDPGMMLSRSGLAHARALVKAGKVSHGPFSFDAEDRAKLLGPNGTHASELQRHHLGTDTSEEDPAKAPAYPFAKDGVAYSRAFRSIARKAAANSHDAVARAANDLMEMARPPEDTAADEAVPGSKKGRAAGRPDRARTGRLQYRDLSFEPTKTDADGSYFEGYAAVLNNIDEYGTIMAEGCFEQDLASFRECGFLGGLNHDWDNPIGKPAVVKLDGRGLFVGGDVLDTAHGLDVRKLFKAGVIRKLSFGFDVLESQWLDEPEDVAAYWSKVGYTPTDQDRDRARRGVVLFTRIKVYEASPVMVPGNQLAGVTAVRSDDGADAETPHLTLDQNALAVRVAVGEFCDRLKQLAALRAQQGRSLAPEKLARLREFRDRLDEAGGRIDDALDACRPRPTKAEIAAFHREWLLLDV